MNYPSIKSLEQIGNVDAKLAHKILVGGNLNTLAEIREKHAPLFVSVDSWIESCYHAPKYHDVKMHMLDIALRTYGVEYIRAGKGAKSPAIEYLNTGDTYNTTLMFINRSYRVGNWGDIVERGNYE